MPDEETTKVDFQELKKLMHKWGTCRVGGYPETFCVVEVREEAPPIGLSRVPGSVEATHWVESDAFTRIG